jgi:DNA-binding SARP family transcriptional activator/tetratricopeptide (TPR) repeat protein
VGQGESAPAELRIWLLGEFRVEVDGEEVTAAAWRRSKARSVVKLLALAHGHRLHREQLMDWLWPELDPDAAGTNLRKAIHFARHAMGAGAVRVSNEVVRLAAAAMWVDVDAFEAAAHAGDVAGALALYTDDLLVEDRFEAWADRRRDQLCATAAQLLLDRSDELERRGDERGAVGALERLVALEPLNEAGHCGLIRLHALGGRRHMALRCYRQLQDRLEVELGVAPGDEARRMFDEILAGGVAAEDAPLDDAGDGSGPLAAGLEEERKLVTIAVVELGGGTARDHGGEPDKREAHPERLRSALDAAATAAAAILGRWGAWAEREIGGTVVAVFGLPVAGERDAERALQAVLEVRDQATVPVRIGVDTGVVVARAALAGGLRGVAGEVVEIAGRLRELAPAGSILASGRTCRAARDTFDLGEREELRLAAGSAPLAAHRVLAARRWAAAGTPVPMVGRDTQLDAVLGVFGDVVASGRPHLLTIVGQAGIGKSRLVAEVLPAVVDRCPGAVVHRGRCLSFGDGVTYWALGEILRETCGVVIGEAAATANARLAERLSSVLAPLRLEEREVAATIAALAATAGIDLDDGRLGQLPPKAVADELGRAWPRFAAALAATGPALLVIEDVHWADDQLLDMLERMVARAQCPLMILATARPELLEAHPNFGTGSHAASVISLSPLAAPASRQLLDGLAAAQRLDESHRDDVLVRAGGNPYFIEQMVIHLAESESSTLPDTLHSLLAARVDALPFPEKRILQEASVMGRTFSDEVLARRLPDEDVATSLAGLERRGLIAANPAATPGGYEAYVFKHALLRDVAYASVSAARRTDAHLAVAAWLEELTSNRDELVELVALHYAAAADEFVDAEPELAEGVRQRAVATLLEAAAAARRRFAVGKAVELDEHALSLATTDEERLRALEALGDDEDAGYRGDAARRRYEAALAIARARPERDPDRSRLCRKYALMMAMNPGSFHAVPDPVMVEELIAEGLATAPDAVSRAHLLVARGASARLWSGSEPFGAGSQPDPILIQTRIDAVDEALSIGESRGLADLVDAAVNTLVILHGLAGDYPGTLSLLERALDRADEAPSTLAHADILRTAAVHFIDMSARYEDGLELAWRAYALTRDDAGPHQLMHVTYPLLAALYHLGRWSELDPLLDEHVAAFRAEPASHCHFVRDGPIIGAVVHCRRGDLTAAGRLARLVREARWDPTSASAWQSFLAAVSGEPATAIALSADKVREGRTYGPQHELAVLEAEVALRDWSTVRAALPHARAHVAGNALLAPWCDRAAGLVAAAEGERREAEAALRRAVDAFDALGVRFEAARTREELAALRPRADARPLLQSALDVYEQVGATPSVQRVRSRLGDDT